MDNRSGDIERVRQLIIELVPEVVQGSIQIMGIAREPGYRAIISLHSTNAGIDAVGVLVGERGARIKTMVKRLSGEKIDVVEWKDSIEDYFKSILYPARFSRVVFDQESNRATIFASSDQIALIVGPQGRRIQLVAQLTGWKIVVLDERK